jgi:hypothetical protein
MGEIDGFELTPTRILFFFKFVTWKFSTGHHPEEDLAKFGYSTRYESSKKIRVILYFGNPSGNLL